MNQNNTSESRSKTSARPSRPKHRRLRQAHRRLAPVDGRPATAAAPVPAPTVAHPQAAAMDAHPDNHVVRVGPNPVETFGASAVDWHAVADDRRQHGVTSVVLESTAVYRVPLVELPESRGFEVFLIEPSQARHGGARPKAGVLDGQWPQRLHTFGLLRPPFRPPESVPALRGYGRQRQLPVRDAASHVRHIQEALEQLHVKLTAVAADVMGRTGTRIIQALRNGERDPQRLAGLRDPSCPRSTAECAKALRGTWRPEHLFALKQALALYQFHHAPITEGDQRVADELARLPDRAGDKPFQPRPRRRGRKNNGARLNATEPLLKAPGVDLTLIDGIDVHTALMILSDLGADGSRSPTEKHFASWLRLRPQVDESNGTRTKRSPRRGKSRPAQASRMAAPAVRRTQTAPAACYQRLKGRLGGKGAMTATAHQLAVLV